MSSFNANSQAFNVATENELAEVLSHYNSEFIFTVIDNAMKKRFTEVPVTVLPNVVGAWEQNFKAIIAQYGESSTSEVLRVRNETYREIVNTICREFGLNFTIDDSVDIYSAAFHLYNLFISGFAENMISFFANFIYRERSAIYDSMGLADLKKNKDSSTAYGKKIYKDIKLAIINANIDRVITQVSSMDFQFYSIIMTIYGSNSEMSKYITSIVSADNEFFNKAYVRVLNSDIRADIITGIRFKLQNLAKIHEQTVESSELNISDNN
jgi:hypothetical protein